MTPVLVGETFTVKAKPAAEVAANDILFDGTNFHIVQAVWSDDLPVTIFSAQGDTQGAQTFAFLKTSAGPTAFAVLPSQVMTVLADHGDLNGLEELQE